MPLRLIPPRKQALRSHPIGPEHKWTNDVAFMTLETAICRTTRKNIWV